MLGAAFAGWATGIPDLSAALVVSLYTAAITWNAAGEVGGKKPGTAVFAPAVVLLAASVFMCRPGVAGRPFVLSAVVVLGIGSAEALWTALHVFKGKMAMPVFIGRLLRVMITLQAALVLWGMAGAGWEARGAVIGGFGILRLGSDITGHWFYGS